MADGLRMANGRWQMTVGCFHGLFSCSRLRRSLSSTSPSLLSEALPGTALLSVPSTGSLMIVCVSGSIKTTDSPLLEETGGADGEGAGAAITGLGAVRSELADDDSGRSDKRHSPLSSRRNCMPTRNSISLVGEVSFT